LDASITDPLSPKLLAWGQTLRRWRASKRWSQMTLADSVGVNHSTVSNWERATAEPRHCNLEQLECLGFLEPYPTVQGPSVLDASPLLAMSEHAERWEGFCERVKTFVEEVEQEEHAVWMELRSTQFLDVLTATIPNYSGCRLAEITTWALDRNAELHESALGHQESQDAKMKRRADFERDVLTREASELVSRFRSPLRRESAQRELKRITEPLRNFWNLQDSYQAHLTELVEKCQEFAKRFTIEDLTYECALLGEGWQENPSLRGWMRQHLQAYKASDQGTSVAAWDPWRQCPADLVTFEQRLEVLSASKSEALSFALDLAEPSLSEHVEDVLEEIITTEAQQDGT